jgi:hypothetical protein
MCARLCLVTFGPDEELLCWIQKHLKWAIDIGLLHVASGGDGGLRQAGQRTGGSAPSVATMKGYEDGAGIQERERPVMKFWHSSIAKNGAPWLQWSMMPILHHACMSLCHYDLDGGWVGVLTVDLFSQSLLSSLFSVCFA